MPTLRSLWQSLRVINVVGLAGQLTNSLGSTIDASGGVFVAEVSLDFPISGLGSRATFRELGKFPAVSRDIAMIVAEDLTHKKYGK